MSPPVSLKKTKTLYTQTEEKRWRLKFDYNMKVILITKFMAKISNFLMTLQSSIFKFEKYYFRVGLKPKWICISLSFPHVMSGSIKTGQWWSKCSTHQRFPSSEYSVINILCSQLFLHQTDKSKVSLSKLKLQHLKYLSIFDNGKINWIISFNREAHCSHIVIQFNLI